VAVHRASIETARHRAAGRTDVIVESACETRDRVEHNENVPSEFHQPFGPFNRHLGGADVLFNGLVVVDAITSPPLTERRKSVVSSGRSSTNNTIV